MRLSFFGRTFGPLLVVLGTNALLATDPLSAQRPGRRWLSYDQAFRSQAPRDSGDAPRDDILTTLPNVTGWLDDDRYLELRTETDNERRLYAVRASDGSAEVYRDFVAMRAALPRGFDPRTAIASPDQNQYLFARDGDLHLFDLPSKELRRLTANPGNERNPRFSPDGRGIAYTRDNNLFAYDVENSLERQLTTDGSETVYNGWASWVYFEEILGRPSQYAAFWWSPDSSKLAFMRFDDAPVPVFPIYHTNGQHGDLERQRYPKAGDANPYVQMGVVPVAGGPIVWMDFEPKADHYIAWPFWTPDSKALTVQWMNRGQDTIRFFNCDPATGKKTQIFEEKQASWVEFFEDLYYFRNGSGFLLRTKVDGWDHLYHYAPDGTLKKRLTSGEWRVTGIARVDEARGIVYFSARRGRMWNSALMRVRLDGTGLETLTKGDGQHSARVSNGGSYYIDTTSNVSSPSAMTLHRADGTVVRPLGNARGAETDQYAWGKAELFTIPSGDGYDLPAYWVLPPDFDPAKKYPVIMSIYGGPDAGTVRNAWLGNQAHYWAERGVITVSVDHRAGGAFGKKGVALMHRSLGKWEMQDLITAATWLRAKPFIAGDRIGIAGGSYGGYTTMMALTFGADHFNYGQAGSSVSDWRLYDTVYTERYMDTPAENPEGYKNCAVLTWVDRYKGGLRITHGTIDDNVHMQNSLQIVDWLTANNKPFEMMLYPGSRHAMQASQRAHASRETHEFWVRNLLGGRLPVQAMTQR
ncbi:MAG: S9 family peptidase [Vicinamibacterales bacterium]